MKTSPFLDEIRAETRVESRVEDILRLLRLRYRSEPPAEVVARVRQEKDLDRLTRWLDATATTNTLDEFLAEFHRS